MQARIHRKETTVGGKDVTITLCKTNREYITIGNDMLSDSTDFIIEVIIVVNNEKRDFYILPQNLSRLETADVLYRNYEQQCHICREFGTDVETHGQPIPYITSHPDCFKQLINDVRDFVEKHKTEITAGTI